MPAIAEIPVAGSGIVAVNVTSVGAIVNRKNPPVVWGKTAKPGGGNRPGPTKGPIEEIRSQVPSPEFAGPSSTGCIPQPKAKTMHCVKATFCELVLCQVPKGAFVGAMKSKVPIPSSAIEALRCEISKNVGVN